MTDRIKNPHPSDTPEWQLWENMESSYAMARSHADDADRSQKKSQEARERGDRFRAALQRLES